MPERGIRTLLLDLDDTLLINDMETFTPHYYRALLAYFQGACPPGLFIEALQAGTRAMFRNDAATGTNEAVFAQVFFSKIDVPKEELSSRFERFYAEAFDALSVHTEADPDARRLVTRALNDGYQLAIATQPVFPRQAILARLRWARVPAEEFAYDFISSYERLGACKPHPLYFQTILDALGRKPEECLMVGDSPGADMPAYRLGMRTFWVNRAGVNPPFGMRCSAQGTLGDLLALIETGGIDAL